MLASQLGTAHDAHQSSSPPWHLGLNDGQGLQAASCCCCSTSRLASTCTPLAMHGARATIVEPRLDRRVVTRCTSSSHQSLPIAHRVEILAMILLLTAAICNNQLFVAAAGVPPAARTTQRHQGRRCEESAPPERYSRPSQVDHNGPPVSQCASQLAPTGLPCRSRPVKGSRPADVQPGSQHDE